jgi:hypothetical protein
MNRKSVKSLSLCALLTASCAAPVELWTAYTGWPTCYRQPFLVKTSRALLAFVEGRPGIAYCSGTSWPDAPDFPILLKRSFDSGATWEPDAINITRGNLDFLVAVYDAQADAVILLVQQGDSGVVQTSSRDDGATWSAPAAPALVAPPELASLIPGVGHGLQLSPRYCLEATCGGTAGRLLVPFVATLVGPVSNDTACGTCATALVASDDHGESWQLLALSEQNGSREAALAQLDSGAFGTMQAVVVASERNLGNATGSRLFALSTDGGVSFSRYGTAPLPDVATGSKYSSALANDRKIFLANRSALHSPPPPQTGRESWRAMPALIGPGRFCLPSLRLQRRVRVRILACGNPWMLA